MTLCDEKSGQCKCKSSFVQGLRCDACMDSMFSLEDSCTRQCNCDPYGSLSPICDKKTGQCVCKSKITGLKCNLCEAGYYNLTSFGCMNKCDCDPAGSINKNSCDSKSGTCQCQPGYSGRFCNICSSGYWKSGSKCVKCECNLNGILDANNICDQVKFTLFSLKK